MASDWIPACKNLSRKREVIAISNATSRTRQEVVGWLLEFWFWCDDESADGRIPDVSVTNLPTVVGADESFWLAVQQVGWLRMVGEHLEIPNFDRWLGRSAKGRLGEAVRKRTQREMSRICPDKNVTTEQNRTEQNKEEKTPLTPRPKNPTATPQEFVEAWNLVSHFPNARDFTGKRLRQFQARIRDAKWEADWRVALKKASESSFCRGENERGWRATIDWFLRPDTVIRLLEGQYDDRRAKGRSDVMATLSEEIDKVMGVAS